MWKETPIPMFLTLYLFNWTNANEVIESKWKVKPKLRECGPYVFTEKHFRVNITFNANDTVTYLQKRVWHFVPDQSNGSLDDKITTVNPIIAVMSCMCCGWLICNVVCVADHGKFCERQADFTQGIGKWDIDGFRERVIGYKDGEGVFV